MQSVRFSHARASWLRDESGTYRMGGGRILTGTVLSEGCRDPEQLSSSHPRPMARSLPRRRGNLSCLAARGEALATDAQHLGWHSLPSLIISALLYSSQEHFRVATSAATGLASSTHRFPLSSDHRSHPCPCELLSPHTWSLHHRHDHRWSNRRVMITAYTVCAR
jgi:hypothetical protein